MASLNRPVTVLEKEWWSGWVDPNTRISFLDMSDGVVPKTSKIKHSLLSDEERAAANKYGQLSEHRKWLWAEYRGAEQTKRTRTHTED